VGRCQDCPPTYDEATFEALLGWRLEVAAEARVPAFVVFTDATLTAIAERRPASRGELALISGVDARKLDRYGADVLAILGNPAATGGPSGSRLSAEVRAIAEKPSAITDLATPDLSSSS
jgi:ribonuclease D